MFESFCAKYSHTFDRLPFGIFSVKRLMASSVCACLLFTVMRLYENTNERERHRTKFTLGPGAVLHVPHGICLATVFRSEEHTSDLQSHLNLVCRLLLETNKTTGAHGVDAVIFGDTTHVTTSASYH